MAYHERLADHVRELIGERTNVTERRMLGGLTFMVAGHMCSGINSDELILRAEPEAEETALMPRMPARWISPAARCAAWSRSRPAGSSAHVWPAGSRRPSRTPSPSRPRAAKSNGGGLTAASRLRLGPCSEFARPDPPQLSPGPQSTWIGPEPAATRISPAARPAARAGRPSPRPLRPRALVSFTHGHAHEAGTGDRRAPAFRDCGSLGRKRKRRGCRQSED